MHERQGKEKDKFPGKKPLCQRNLSLTTIAIVKCFDFLESPAGVFQIFSIIQRLMTVGCNADYIYFSVLFPTTNNGDCVIQRAPSKATFLNDLLCSYRVKGGEFTLVWNDITPAAQNVSTEKVDSHFSKVAIFPFFLLLLKF